ncbi:hypothetical protein [Pyxidicoccus sp. MSG2]|uniref:hypothetical protein n=1 Tax=Pyxidicoccus sp. MSG2 TaxID=2996790 RepID=UPI002271123D|nr:hypothetical protein [Pyxidicoccus sp. MSG2]MCY1023528.1 hypothetical protein [Pyxidicoccus sp. MSG2]
MSSKISRNPSPQSISTPSEPKPSAAPEKNTATVAASTPKPLRATDGFDAPKSASRQTVSLDTPTRQQLGGTGGTPGVATVTGPGEDGKMTVRVETNMHTVYPLGLPARGYIEIRVTPLNLNIAPENLQAEMDRAMAEKQADDASTYGAELAAHGYSSLEEWSRDTGYYGSPSHIAWAEAASARSGGQIPAEYWMRFDPFGGTAGNGPNILPTGEYPGALSRIAMAHDTDWDLGRYFGAGPLASLRGQPHPENLGTVGLIPGQGVDNYSTGHADWQVTYGSEVILPGSPPPPQIA